MGDVTGPISSLPGAHHPLSDGAKCDNHLDRNAVANVQGETDSFGCETHCLCKECLDAYREEINSPEARTGECEWCKQASTDLGDRRDYDEGMYGRVYRVCGACRKRQDDEIQRDLDYYSCNFGD